MEFTTRFTTNIENGWEVLGPGGGGTFYFPAISPHDSNTYMVSGDMTGTYISHNAGATWAMLNIKSRADYYCFDPIKAGVIYAGSTGLFRSTDNGRVWDLVFPSPEKITGEKFIGDEALHHYISSDNWPGGRIQTIAIDPEDSKCIYIGNGIGDSIGLDADELVVFKSSDYGETWSDCGKFDGSIIRRIYVDPTSPVGSKDVYVFTDTKLYRLSGEGKSEIIMLPDRVGDRSNIAGSFLRPVSHGVFWGWDIVYAKCVYNKNTRRNIFFILTNQRIKDGKYMSGVLKSEDNGITWREIDGGLGDSFEGAEVNNCRWFNAVAFTSTCETMYIAVWRLPSEKSKEAGILNYYGVMKSSDYGETWNWCLKIDLNFADNMKTSWQEAKYDTDWMSPPFHMTMSESNPDVCLFTTMGCVYSTRDGGKTWNQHYCTPSDDGSTAGNNLEITGSYGVHFDPFNKDHLVVTYTDIGMIHSFNRGESWKSAIEGVPFDWINTSYWMVFDPDVKGRAWSAWANCHDLPREKMFVDDHIITSPYKGGVCRSENGIESWTSSSGGLPEKCIATDILMDPFSKPGNRTLYITACGKGVYKSTDDGYTWAWKSNGLGVNIYAWQIRLLPDGTLYLLNARSLINNNFFAGSIFKSTDGAETWQQVAMPASADAPVNIDFDISHPETMYLTCWPDVEDKPERGGGIYKTEDGGKTWINIYDPSAYCYGITVDRENPQILYMTTFQNYGCRSDDAGKTWHKLKGYDFKWGRNVIPDPYDKDKIYIATFGAALMHGPSA